MDVSPASVSDLLRGLAFVLVSWVTFTVGAILVSLRMYIRATRRATGWDDFLILIALIIALFGSITNVFQVANGLGRHIETLTPAEQSGFAKWTLIAEVQIIIGTSFTKVSVCCLILRMISRTQRKVTYLVYVLTGFVIVTTVGLVIAFLVQCRPLRAVYNPTVAGKCYSKHVVFSVAYGQGAISVLTDFTCAALPFFVLRNLQMKKNTKIALSLVMGLGVFTASCSIFRTAFLYLNYKKDVTHANLVNVVFAMLEENLGIIAASVATLRPLFKRSGHMARIPSNTPSDEFPPSKQLVSGSNTAESRRTLEDGPVPLYPMGITKTTAFKVLRNERERG